MLAARGGANVSVHRFNAPFDSSIPIPTASQWAGSGAAFTHADRRVGYHEATGLPAFLRGVRLLSETVAMMPVGVYQGRGHDRTPVENAPQLALLEQPNPDMTPMQAWAYAVASMIRGNAYLLKVKTQAGVERLYPVPPGKVTPKYDKGEPRFEIRDKPMGPIKMTVGRDQIIHIPGILLDDPFVGVSVVTAHRNGLGTMLARQEFEGRYLANDGTPGVVLKTANNTTAQQRAEIRDSYEARHQGVRNAGRPAVLWGGWELDTLGASLDDAQFIQSANFSVQDIARMLGIPSGFLGDPQAPGGDSPEQENMRFLQFGLAPWMARLEQGLSADADLFTVPDMHIKFEPDGLLRADIKTRFDAYRLARQGGWITGNEIRCKEGLPEIDGGDELQQTPVGGAPNTPTTSPRDGEQPSPVDGDDE